MIEIIASATIGGIVGFGVCAALTAGKVADAQDDPETREMLGQWLQMVHRIDRALDCETPNAAHGVKKMAAILRGDA